MLSQALNTNHAHAILYCRCVPLFFYSKNNDLLASRTESYRSDTDLNENLAIDNLNPNLGDFNGIWVSEICKRIYNVNSKKIKLLLNSRVDQEGSKEGMWVSSFHTKGQGRPMRFPETFELQMFVFEKPKNHSIQSVVVSSMIPIG